MRQRSIQHPLLLFFCYLFFSALLTSCGSSRRINTDYLYFRDGAKKVSVQLKKTIIQPNDLLSIQVYSRTLNQEQAAIFNIPTTGNSPLQGYQVDSTGNIEMPIIGIIKVAGLSKEQLQTELVKRLAENVKNPSVLIRFLQYNINVLGEVRSPGTKNFYTDKVTIIDALSAAGDLTDYGKRENIMVIREEDGQKNVHTVDLRNREIFQSPVYILQPNDIVYVSPNRNKLKNLNVDPDVQRKTGIFLTIFSVALSVISLVVFSFR